MNWYLKVLKQYANFRGRARRKEFWLFFLIHSCVILVLALISGRLNDSFVQNIDFGLFANLFFIYLFVTVIPTFAVMARRLHDQNRNRLLVLLPIVPYIGSLALVILMCLPGNIGKNKYGPDPKKANNEIDEIGR